MSNTKTTQKQMGNDPVLGRKAIIQKLLDRHPEVSKKKLMSLSKAHLSALLMLAPKKFSSMFSPSKTLKGKDVHPGTEKKRTLKRRGGGIAKRGFGIAK